MADLTATTPDPESLLIDDEALKGTVAGRAVLTEANRFADIVHTTLAGMMAIVVVLLYAVALPVFGQPPVTNMAAFVVMLLTSLGGIGYLYYYNYRVHRHVSTQAQLTEVLVNSLGQGFLSFDSTGVCGRVYSQACLDLLETTPGRQPIVDVLRIPADEHSDFKDWLNVLFMPDHALGFDDVVKFLPAYFPHSGARRVSLMYRPIRGKAGELRQIVVIATDQTDEYDAQQHALEQQNYANMICRIFKERNQFLATVTQVRKFIEVPATTVTHNNASPLLRILHTLKASAKHFYLNELNETVRRLENDLRSEKIKSDADFQTLLQNGQTELQTKLDAVMAQVSEVIGHDYEGRGNLHEIEESVLYDFAIRMKQANIAPSLIQHYLSTIAAVPIQDCFVPFERELRDLAELTGKQVKPIRYTGSNPRVLTRPIQELLLSLTHICRNIVDHGIEPSVTRLARGKDPMGQVIIHADTIIDEQHASWLHMIIGDDGGGIDPSRVRAKLASTDPQGDWRTEDDQAVIQRIFSWGFSIRDQVTDLSGRGVGMEAVEREVKLLGGEIKVYSELYHGTRFDIRIPYSLDLDDSL